MAHPRMVISFVVAFVAIAISFAHGQNGTITPLELTLMNSVSMIGH